MKTPSVIAVLLSLTAQLAFCDEPVAKQFLKYTYGAEGVDAAKLFVTANDVWMIPGAKDTNALAAVEAERFDSKKLNGIVSGILGTDMYFIELRNGKVDPAFNLEGVRSVHRQVVMAFLYHSLRHDKSMLGRVTTDANTVEIVGKKADPGDMDQYASILESIPMIRSSTTEADAKTKTITYRVPLGETGLSLTLMKQDGLWKIDTTKKVKVPLEFFFREDEGGRRVR